MVLSGLFKKEDCAEKFKEAFENRDADKIMEVLESWHDECKDDANFGLAMVIMGSMNEKIDFNDTFELYLSSIKDECVNKELFDWFNGKALELMERKVDEEIGFSEMFNNKYKSNQASNNHAKDFLNIFENLLDSGDIDASKVSQLNGIVEEWENDCPDDANMHCAFVILNVAGMSDDELKRRAEKANECTPEDKNMYPKFLAFMQGVCKVKQD